jgi:hypothetical protein
MGIVKHFFSNKDVEIRMKHNIYNAFAINAALWDWESWNLSAKKTQKNARKLSLQHYQVDPQHQVGSSEKLKNEEQTGKILIL